MSVRAPQASVPIPGGAAPPGCSVGPFSLHFSPAIHLLPGDAGETTILLMPSCLDRFCYLLFEG